MPDKSKTWRECECASIHAFVGVCGFVCVSEGGAKKKLTLCSKTTQTCISVKRDV